MQLLIFHHYSSLKYRVCLRGVFHTTPEASLLLGPAEDKMHKCRLTKAWEHRINNILIPWSQEENKLIKELFDNLKASNTGKMQFQRVSSLEAEKQGACAEVTHRDDISSNLKLPRASLINPDAPTPSEIVGALRPSFFGAAFSKVAWIDCGLVLRPQQKVYKQHKTRTRKLEEQKIESSHSNTIKLSNSLTGRCCFRETKSCKASRSS